MVQRLILNSANGSIFILDVLSRKAFELILYCVQYIRIYLLKWSAKFTFEVLAGDINKRFIRTSFALSAVEGTNIVETSKKIDLFKNSINQNKAS